MSLIGDAAGALTGNIGLYALAGAIAIGTGAWGYERVQRADSDSALAEERAASAMRETELTNRALAAEQRERAIEQARAKALQEITDATNAKIAAADAAASAADVSARSLRDRVQALAAAGRRACGNPAVAGGSTATPDPIGVLADVLGRADKRAGLLALEADKRRIRAIACEDAFEALRTRYPQSSITPREAP